MTDKLNTRRCFVATDIKETQAFTSYGKVTKITQVELKETPFMELNTNDVFVLFEDTGEMVIATDKDTQKEYTASKALDKPFVEETHGVFSVKCDPYIFPTNEVKFLRR